MELKLEELEYQQQAIQSVVKIFEGQEKNTFDNSYFHEIKANFTNLTTEQIKDNVKSILLTNSLDESICNLSDDNDYCIEMETGTGKTLVYICSVYELYRQYGFTKFIILVPSIAIKEGVLTTLSMFEKQLVNLYGFKVTSFEYDSKKLNRIRHFISDTVPQIMVMTIQSFSSDDRIINQEGRDDGIWGLSYLQAIGKSRPIIIMDEPQEGMDTENAVERIKTLNPLCKLRYSATHKVLKNLLYRLTPYDAYKQGLVKKIEVLSVAEKNDEATLKIEVTQIQTKAGQSPKAKFKLWKYGSNKFDWKETGYLKVKDNLGEKSKNVSYQDYTIERIYKSLRDGKFHVKFTNGVELIEKERSADFSGIFRQQLHWLIRQHFKKRGVLLPSGIKCLSLVFIDRVDNYVKDDGIIKKLFIEEYAKIYRDFYGEDPTSKQISDAQGYYFAKTGKDEYTDSEISMNRNKEIYDLILRDKEKLLSLENPVEFIFSHSALGVGWDNPNVFNIATLNQSYSEIKKRQEIGRGLRICVNQQGQRVYDPENIEEGNETNLLTVIPNETYEAFAIQYQEQIKEIYGTTAAGSEFRHTHKGEQKNKSVVKRNERIFQNKSFREFWKRLSLKTDYTVAFEEENIVERAIEALNRVRLPEYEAEVVLTRIQEMSGEAFKSEEIGRETEKLRASFSPFDIVEELSENTGLSYPTAMRIVTGLTNFEEVAKNPPRFIQEACVKIKNIELDEMFRALTYTISDKKFDIKELKETFETFLSTKDTPDRGVYEKTIYESNVEREFAGYAENDHEVVCFLKLPEFYKIPTPIGSYNPDWGIVIKRRRLKDKVEEEFYFVIETKNTNNLDDRHALTDAERYKIKCAIKHFQTIGIETEIRYEAPVKDYKTDFKNKI